MRSEEGPRRRGRTPSMGQRAAIILAAGASTRAGSPKATVPGASGTMLESTCRPFLEVDATPLVVTGYEAKVVEDLARELDLRWVRNPTPWNGMQSSIRVGLHALEPWVELVFIQPVDCPGISPETLKGLLSAVGTNQDALAAKPVYQGSGGHPVLLKRRAWRLFLDSRESENLREFLQSLGTKVLRVETADRAVVRDLDTLDEIERWVQDRTG
jgi:molybdenum cofactor cytidylyltransferase